MARKTSSLPTRVWSFACRVDDEIAVQEAMFRARRYYNVLVEIERRRVDRFRAIRRDVSPELADAEDRLDQIEEEIEQAIHDAKRVRQAHFVATSEKVRILPEDAEVAEARLVAERKALQATAKPLRTAFADLLRPPQAEHKRRSTELCAGRGPRIKGDVNAEVLAAMLDEAEWSDAWKRVARSDDDARREWAAARASCNLATGTYLQVEESFQRAKKDSSPRAPRFRRFDGEGKLAVQLRDVRVSALSAPTGNLTLRPAAHDPAKRGDQTKMVHVSMAQSVKRDGARVTCTAKLHRVMPHDAAVKWVTIIARRIGRRTVYRLQFTLEHTSFAEPKRPAGLRASEHVRIGWAKVDGGVRVAHYPGGDVVVPTSVLDQHEHAASVESLADRRYDRARRLLRLVTRMAGHRFNAWHRMGSDRARHQLRVWCTEYARFAFGDALGEMWRDWKAERKARGEDLYADACLARRMKPTSNPLAWWCFLWARKDEHLQQLAVDSRRRFAHRRDAHFRREAIRLATEFESLTVDKYNVASLRVLPSLTMPGDGVTDQQQHNAHAAAPGRFREILIEVMGPRCTPRERSGGDGEGGVARAKKNAQLGVSEPSESTSDKAAE